MYLVFLVCAHRIITKPIVLSTSSIGNPHRLLPVTQQTRDRGATTSLAYKYLLPKRWHLFPSPPFSSSSSSSSPLAILRRPFSSLSDSPTGKTNQTIVSERSLRFPPSDLLGVRFLARIWKNLVLSCIFPFYFGRSSSVLKPAWNSSNFPKSRFSEFVLRRLGIF